ncbi:MAG: ATP synthase F1 subunit delta [Deltaproteobacteria bacterium]|nr:ATP synthase F1 subunit delta [Deltaproteobacteria bacterium]
MIGGSVARRYARALLDIGQQERKARQILAEVGRFARFLSEAPPLKEALSAAHINRRDKHAALEAAIARLSVLPVTRNFLLLLIDKGRVGILPQILVELRRFVEEAEGVERVEVVVPMAMSGTQRDLLRTTLERQTGKKVELEESVDPAVLGGMVVKVGSTVYDGSIRTQIEQIRQNLEKG